MLTQERTPTNQSEAALGLPSKIARLLPQLVCPYDHSPLRATDGALLCERGHRHPIGEGKTFFVDAVPRVVPTETTDPLYRLKNLVKKRKRWFRLLYIMQPAQAVGPGPALLDPPSSEPKTILNLGSGVPLYDRAGSTEMIHVDFFPYEGVDLVCNAEHLPFRDGEVDGIYNESLVEHLRRPETLLKEIKRVLKPGGLAYLVIPQVAPFHASPDDYRRWTIPGGRELLSDFDIVDVGVRHGPVSALLWLLQDFLAITLSMGNKRLYPAWLALLMVLTFPIKFLDFLFARLPGASNVACTIYYLVRKK